MKTFPKVITVDTTRFQLGELIDIYFALYNVASAQGLTYMLNLVCENSTILWVFPNAPKRSPVIIICFTLTTLKNKTNQ